MVVLRVEMVPVVSLRVVPRMAEAKAKAEESTALSTLLVMQLDLRAEEDLVWVDYLMWEAGGWASVPSVVEEVDVGQVSRLPMGVKGCSILAAADVLLVADVTRMVEHRVMGGSTSTLTPMVEAVLVLDVPRVWAEKGSTSLLVEAVLVVMGVLRVWVGESTSTGSSMVEAVLMVGVKLREDFTTTSSSTVEAVLILGMVVLVVDILGVELST
jgi:hypothetical protein